MTSRRSFLRALGLGAVAAPFLPDVLRGEPAPALVPVTPPPGYYDALSAEALVDGGPWSVPSGGMAGTYWYHADLRLSDGAGMASGGTVTGTYLGHNRWVY